MRRGRGILGVVIGALVAVALPASSLWRPGGVPVTVLIFMLAGVAALGHLGWQLATGRQGLIHRGPTKRRRRRLDRRQAGSAR
jgi:hypothetical protein